MLHNAEYACHKLVATWWIANLRHNQDPFGLVYYDEATAAASQ